MLQRFSYGPSCCDFLLPLHPSVPLRKSERGKGGGHKKTRKKIKQQHKSKEARRSRLESCVQQSHQRLLLSYDHPCTYNHSSKNTITQNKQYRIMVDQTIALQVTQCPSSAAVLGYTGVAAAVCLSNWGSAVSSSSSHQCNHLSQRSVVGERCGQKVICFSLREKRNMSSPLLLPIHH